MNRWSGCGGSPRGREAQLLLSNLAVKELERSAVMEKADMEIMLCLLS